MSDPRIPKLMAALRRRFPGSTVISEPFTEGIYDEAWIRVLNAPDGPPGIVHDVASELIDEIWGDDIVPVMVGGVRRDQTAKYFAKYLPKPRAVRKAKRPRAAVATTRRRATKRRARAAR
jgi:hypothetical protein